MYSIIQKIYEKNNKILKEGLKNVLNGADVSTLTGAIKDFTDILGKELFSEIVTQIENLVFDDEKRKNQYESVRYAEKSLITKNGKTKFERRYYKDKLTGCCQEGQVHHTLSERLSTDAKVWNENGIDEMSQLRAFTQNGGDIYQKIIDISTREKREKKIQELEKRIRKKANKRLFGTTGIKIPISRARDELYYELKNIWYGKAV